MAIVHIFGLTGGIGSGKSTVAKHWRSRGLPVVDADHLARLAVAPASEALRAIVARFGEDILNDDGTLRRDALAAKVFSNPSQRQQLNAIVHPQVQMLARQRFAELAGEAAPLACYEVPLLFETGQQDRYRPIVVVTVSEATQLARIQARDGLGSEAIKARIASQWPLPRKVAEADHVIDNDGTIEATLRQADAVLATICSGLGVVGPGYARGG